jgi:hypothetical protein
MSYKIKENRINPLKKNKIAMMMMMMMILRITADVCHVIKI